MTNPTPTTKLIEEYGNAPCVWNGMSFECAYCGEDELSEDGHFCADFEALILKVEKRARAEAEEKIKLFYKKLEKNENSRCLNPGQGHELENIDIPSELWEFIPPPPTKGSNYYVCRNCGKLFEWQL